MKRIKTIFFKDLWAELGSPFYYVVHSVVFFLLSLFFYSYLKNAGQITLFTLPEKILRPLFGNLSFVYMLVVPLFGARSIVIEKERGTYDLIKKSGMSFYSIIFAKFSSVMVLISIFLLVAFSFPLILTFMGASIYSELLAFASGVFLLTAYLVSSSIFFSSISKSSFQAISLSIFFNIFSVLFFIVSFSIDSYSISAFFSYISFPYHYANFSSGILNTNSIVFFVSSSCFFIYSSVKALESE